MKLTFCNSPIDEARTLDDVDAGVVCRDRGGDYVWRDEDDNVMCLLADDPASPYPFVLPGGPAAIHIAAVIGSWRWVEEDA